MKRLPSHGLLRLSLLLLFLLPTLTQAQDLSHPQAVIDFAVNTTDDTTDINIDGTNCDDSSAACSLRAAIQEANFITANSGGTDSTRVTVPAGTYTLTLTGGSEDAAFTGDLDVTGVVEIIGAGPGQTVIDINQVDTGFHIINGSLTLRDLTLTNGLNNSPVGMGVTNGGAIHVNGGALTLENVVVQNSSADYGGGIQVDDGASVSISSSSLVNNSANISGGGLDAFGSASISLTDVTISGNIAPAGAGIHLDTSGVPNSITLAMAEVTLSSNTATGTGGGLRNVDGAAITTERSILAGNSAAASPDCSGDIGSDGTNLLSSSEGCTVDPNDIVTLQPKLKALAVVMPGDMPMHALLPISPAVDALPSAACTSGSDQRGVLRPQLDGCDLGAYELTLSDIDAPASFSLLTPADDTVFTETNALTALTWSDAGDAVTYTVALDRSSPAGAVISPTTVDAAEVCSSGTCSYAIDAAVQALLSDGIYTWTVSATNPGGTVNASNQPFSFTMDAEAVELIQNGGFESRTTEEAGFVADDWKGSNNRLRTDKVRKNKDKDGDGVDDKIFSYEGDAALRFKGALFQARKVKQKLKAEDYPAVDAIALGDSLHFSAAVRGKRVGSAARIIVKVFFPEEDTVNPNRAGLPMVDRLKISLPEGTYDYVQLPVETYTVPTEVSGITVSDVLRVVVVIKYRERTDAGAQLYLDAVSLLHDPQAPATLTTPGLLPVPQAPQRSGWRN